jgi:ubiquinone/menaquinone biosynthesis C-methylase UbiE
VTEAMAINGLSEANERVRRIFDRAASRYDRTMDVFERLMVGDGRRWACSQAEGKVLEIAIGTGRNLPHYPDAIELVGLDLSPAMLEIAARRARELGRDVELREGNAEELPFGDEVFNTVVCTLSLCTIPDARAAVAEVGRVLRPGGGFVFCEHVRSSALPVRLVQGVLEPLFVHLEGDHLLREPIGHLDAESFVIDEVQRSKLGIIERTRAHKPAERS